MIPLTADFGHVWVAILLRNSYKIQRILQNKAHFFNFLIHKIQSRGLTTLKKGFEFFGTGLFAVKEKR